MNLSRHRLSKGFTLFELLVSMSVVAILALVTLATVKLRPDAIAIEEAANRVANLGLVARSQAILKGGRARLLINYNPSDIEGYLRQIGVVVETAYNSGKWITVDRGFYLPKGVRFTSTNPDLGLLQSFSLNFPSNDSESDAGATATDSKPWLALVFENDGRVAGNKNIVLALELNAPSASSSGVSSKSIMFKRSGASIVY